jgi:hypothetical protein
MSLGVHHSNVAVIAMGNEVTENDELIRQDVSLIFEVVKNKLAAFLVKEKAKGRLVKKANEEELADLHCNDSRRNVDGQDKAGQPACRNSGPRGNDPLKTICRPGQTLNPCF